MGKQTLAEIGELAFIRRIRSMMPGEGGSIIRSVGDDCLVVEPVVDRQVLYTTDTFVDGVHFSPEFGTYEEIGLRCMAASVSDIAAMSGIPSYSLVSLSMPKTMVFDDAVCLFTGLSKTAERYGCPVCGGETTSTPGPLTVTITVIGSVEPERLKTRSGAHVGDGIFITGCMGDAMAGLFAFQEREDGFGGLKRKFLTPEARVDLSRELTGSYGITAMIDLSDGLASDLSHICEESGVGALVETGRFPLSEDLLRLLARTDQDPIEFAVTAGEDFELLFTSGDRVLPDFFRVLDLLVTKIGTIIEPSRGILLRHPDGTEQKLTVRGYEHFTS